MSSDQGAEAGRSTYRPGLEDRCTLDVSRAWVRRAAGAVGVLVLTDRVMNAPSDDCSAHTRATHPAGSCVRDG